MLASSATCQRGSRLIASRRTRRIPGTSRPDSSSGSGSNPLTVMPKSTRSFSSSVTLIRDSSSMRRMRNPSRTDCALDAHRDQEDRRAALDVARRGLGLDQETQGEKQRVRAPLLQSQARSALDLGEANGQLALGTRRRGAVAGPSRRAGTRPARPRRSAPLQALRRAGRSPPMPPAWDAPGTPRRRPGHLRGPRCPGRAAGSTSWSP